MPQSAIDQAYNELLRQTEEFLVELKSRQEQQRVEEEEAEKMRKIKEEQVSKFDLPPYKGCPGLRLWFPLDD